MFRLFYLSISIFVANNTKTVKLIKLIKLFVATIFCFTLHSQTAVNFSVKDCTGQLYTLFDELNAGKVVVLTWTMPCGSCVLPLKTTYNVVQSFESTHPGIVQMLMADDYANTSCSSIDLWATSNGMPNTKRFSNPAIRMLDYGSNGMPKVVVIGGPEKQVFYNANDAVNHTALQAAIQSAISVITSLENPKIQEDLKLTYSSPNGILYVNGKISETTTSRLEIYSLSGQLVHVAEKNSEPGVSNMTFKLPALPRSVYIARIFSGNRSGMLKLLIE